MKTDYTTLIKCIIDSADVDFLTEPWERRLYASVLYNATEWGKKIDKGNIDYRKRNRVIDKYNI